MEVTNYISFVTDIKQKIRAAQVKATLSANAQMIQMYWDIGKMIAEKQKIEGWGANVISKLSLDLKKEMPELKGFSERNYTCAPAFNFLFFGNHISNIPIHLNHLRIGRKCGFYLCRTNFLFYV